MSRGGAGNTLGVGGTRRKLSRKEIRGDGAGGTGRGGDPAARKRELPRKLKEGRTAPGAS
ncbi:DUF6243 family protein [Streptomyces sp. HMX112]|uniref:DUF6243 family protein n=1 Tax=Streptomyces sp. HMX112 TaxID=3390850 RepID=UPI003A812DDA